MRTMAAVNSRQVPRGNRRGEGHRSSCADYQARQPVARSAFRGAGPERGPDSIFGFMRGMEQSRGYRLLRIHEEEWERMFNEKWDRIEKGPTE